MLRSFLKEFLALYHPESNTQKHIKKHRGRKGCNLVPVETRVHNYFHILFDLHTVYEVFDLLCITHWPSGNTQMAADTNIEKGYKSNLRTEWKRTHMRSCHRQLL